MKRFIEKHGNKLVVVSGLIFVMSIVFGLSGCGQDSTSVSKGEVLMLDRNTSYVVENPNAVAHNDNGVVVLGGDSTVVTQSDECGDGGTLADGICIITTYSSSSSPSSSSSSSSSEALCEGDFYADGICISHNVSSSSSLSSEEICGDGNILADGVCVNYTSNSSSSSPSSSLECGEGNILADGICVNYTVSSSSSSSSSEASCDDGYIFADGVCILAPENDWPTTYDECVVKGWGWIQWTDENGTADGACALDIGPN